MKDILFHYNPVNPTTWVYLSSLLMIGMFFKFGRLWSLRNLDLVGLILLAPGLLLAEHGKVLGGGDWIVHLGYVWLFIAGGLFMVRLLLDPMMVRRPLLEPNLSVGGMTFLGLSLLLFLMANVITRNVDPVAVEAAKTGDDFFQGETSAGDESAQEVPAPKDRLSRYGPGYPLLFSIPRISMSNVFATEHEQGSSEQQRHDQRRANVATARLMAILSHLAIISGIVVIGYRHFDNYKTGIAVATLYLMLPYTAQKTGAVDHVLPAALLVWVLVAYRRPLVSGLLMGLAIGVVYYPLFLLPLWIAFYWRRGLVRFGSGVLITIMILVAVLAAEAAHSDNLAEFPDQLRQMAGLAFPSVDSLEGFWQPQFTEPSYRIPVIAAFLALCGSLALWPAQKNFGTLISCSAAVMLGTQFWHGHGGGLYMAWYLPILLLSIFRPNLEDRVAIAVLGEGWRPKWLGRKEQTAK